ncbi:importin-7-like isoform X1 [Octopus vulgaris]|uniref:Importin-7-like isoform X1 n=1 Tax=Octopus vulgaris TaxID=6645 RepID=A0AA36FGY5_OCTVU|nr:importin-7-like isoform X1 [Octopus vulgaris]
MDINKLVDLLRGTLDPSLREQAESELQHFDKLNGFAPALMMTIVMSDNLEITVKQAAVSYFKNLVKKYWDNSEIETDSATTLFSISEEDRAAVRRHIIEAIIHSPDIIRSQLSISLSIIVKHDYPNRWPTFVEKIAACILSQNHTAWNGALVSLYQLVKVHESKKPKDRDILNTAMGVELPLIYNLFVKMLPDPSPMSSIIQKQILKIFYSFVRKHLSLKIISRNVFNQWMEVICQVMQNPVPEGAHNIEEDKRPDLPWWKAKKWAARILTFTFQKYGSPGKVNREYKQFSEWYLRTFPRNVIPILINILGNNDENNYIAPRVLRLILNYLNRSISYASTWKYLKNYTDNLIQKVIFPLMWHSEKDNELWNSDPHEYIRRKFDLSDMSTIDAAGRLFHSLAGKRSGVLEKAMNFCMTILNKNDVSPQEKDGIMHMLGTVADILVESDVYKERIEAVLVTHLFPEFQSQHGFLRARAFWTLDFFNGAVLKNYNNLLRAIEMSRECLCNDSELPVRVEAAMALQMLVTKYEKAREFLRPHVRPVIFEVLRIIRETENDELTSVFRRLIRKYADDILPVALEIITHLEQTFNQLLSSNVDTSEDKVIIGLGILYTMDTVLDVVKGKIEIISQLESNVLNVVVSILQQNLIDFYEEVFSLIYNLTKTQISTNMWEIFKMLYQALRAETLDYFIDMAPCLHNYITVDTTAFLSQPEYLEAVYNMCKSILTSEKIGEDSECHAAKLIEVVLLQYKGQIDHVVPSLIELAVKRLARNIETLELRAMCLLICIAGLCYNPALLFSTLQDIQLPNLSGQIIPQFLTTWLNNINSFHGVHDRKLNILGLCTLINTPLRRPKEITELGGKFLPSILTLFKGLKRSYILKAQEVDLDEDNDHDSARDELDILDSDEDEIFDSDDEHPVDDDDDGDNAYDDFSDDEEDIDKALENYPTLIDNDIYNIDEYIIFKDCMEIVMTQDSNWHHLLTSVLNADQRKNLEEVFHTTEQRKIAAESKKIKQDSGYAFSNSNVPLTFNFGSKGL